MTKILLSLLGRLRDIAAGSGPVIDVKPGSPEWESLCLRCGECCVELVFDEDDNLTASTMCEYLDPATRLCTVYENRFAVCHDCIRLTGENLPRFDWLPDTCGYVVRFGIEAGKRGR